MHVAIDLSALMPQPSGVDTYLRELVTRELHENGRVIRERTWEETIPRDNQ